MRRDPRKLAQGMIDHWLPCPPGWKWEIHSMDPGDGRRWQLIADGEPREGGRNARQVTLPRWCHARSEAFLEYLEGVRDGLELRAIMEDRTP